MHCKLSAPPGPPLDFPATCYTKPADLRFTRHSGTTRDREVKAILHVWRMRAEDRDIVTGSAREIARGAIPLRGTGLASRQPWAQASLPSTYPGQPMSPPWGGSNITYHPYPPTLSSVPSDLGFTKVSESLQALKKHPYHPQRSGSGTGRQGLTRINGRATMLAIAAVLMFGAVLASGPIAGQHGTAANIRMDVISSIR